MNTVLSASVGFGFVYKSPEDSEPKTFVDLSVNGQSILIAPSVARKLADQLNTFADYVEQDCDDNTQGEDDACDSNDS